MVVYLPTAARSPAWAILCTSSSSVYIFNNFLSLFWILMQDWGVQKSVFIFVRLFSISDKFVLDTKTHHFACITNNIHKIRKLSIHDPFIDHCILPQHVLRMHWAKRSCQSSKPVHFHLLINSFAWPECSRGRRHMISFSRGASGWSPNTVLNGKSSFLLIVAGF